MRLRVRDESIPYPLIVLRGRLRLSGLSYLEIEQVIGELQSAIKEGNLVPDHDELVQECHSLLSQTPKRQAALGAFDLLTKYEEVRRTSDAPPPLVLVIEGASATGKSMLAVEMIACLAATRTINTDTVRQVLRSIYDRNEHPELFCHTYQAHKHRMAGPEEHSDAVRGFIAQCELITPFVVRAVERILEEGTVAVVEGVHVVPGTFATEPGVIEVLIDPNPGDHLSMFKAKSSASGLKTVSDNDAQREAEFKAASEIQDYMVECAKRALRFEDRIIVLDNYEQAFDAVRRIIIVEIRKLLETIDNK
jgi:2-phosphoglycerate kinase